MGIGGWRCVAKLPADVSTYRWPCAAIISSASPHGKPHSQGENMNVEKYQYLECGLDDVYLLNGFKRFESVRGTSVAIHGVDTLHRAIGLFLCRRRKELSGKELRFLRREMLMSQVTLAHLLDVTEQTIHRWEAGKCRAPKAAENIVRLLYTEQTTGRVGGSVRNRLKRIADLEDEIDHMREVLFELVTDETNRGSAGEQSQRWELAA